MNKVELQSQISRGVTEMIISPYELFFDYFRTVPYFVHHTGITDRYGNVVDSDDDDNDEDNDDIPSAGIDLLRQEVTKFVEFARIKGIVDLPCDIDLPIHRFSNFEANVFCAYIILEKQQTIVQLRISPTRRRTMTAFTIFTRDETPATKTLVEYASQFIAPLPTKKDKIHIITQSNGDFYLKDIVLRNSKKTKFSFDHYNEDFEELSSRVINTLQNDNESGLVLFHGDAGTGKTSYLKHLLHTISNKKLIYMPPDLTEHLSSPGFITFMMSEAINSILLIEDAENVLRHREAGGNQAVSNILNISDGILGDVLKLQIVCTFNSPLSQIDPALRRPGRCIAEYRFEKLSEDRTAYLMKKLHGDIPFTDKEMTLAEVFNFQKPKDMSKIQDRGVGFVSLQTKKKGKDE